MSEPEKMRLVPERRIKTIALSIVMPASLRIDTNAAAAERLANAMGREIAAKLIEFNKVVAEAGVDNTTYSAQLDVIVPETPPENTGTNTRG